MTFITDKALDKIKAAADEKGAQVSFLVPSSETVLSDTGEVTVTETPTTVNTFTPVGYANHLIDGDIIQASDLRLIVPAKGLTFTPEVGRKVVVPLGGTEIWTIERVSKLPGDVPVAWDLQLRR